MQELADGIPIQKIISLILYLLKVFKLILKPGLLKLKIKLLI